MTKLRPIGDHVLVRPLGKEEKTASGLFLPDSAQEKPQQGEILALGEGKYVGDTLITFEKMGLKVGQIVLLSKYGPTEIKLDGEEFYIVDANDIIGVVEK
jgi:chaperonin GroES